MLLLVRGSALVRKYLFTSSYIEETRDLRSVRQEHCIMF